MTKPFLFLQALAEQRNFPWQEPAIASKVEIADQYRLGAGLLAGRQAVVLTMHQDQWHLAAHQHELEHYVCAGGALVIQGHVALPFLSCLSVFRPIERAGPADLALGIEQPEHPLFRGLDPKTLAVRKGVAGFYARGGSEPPPDARILTRINSGQCPVDWVHRLGQGLVFMHPGNDLWTTFADREGNLDLTRRLFDWLADWRATDG